jgi:type IV pilus assembly protein PilB
MGVDDFLVASSVNAIVAQRLVRKLCPACKRKTRLDEKTLINLGFFADQAGEIELYEPVGCPECTNSGYKGRTGLYEVLTVTEEIQELILKKAGVLKIREVALSQGMKTMRQSGLVKLAAGVTSLSEVLRVTV